MKNLFRGDRSRLMLVLAAVLLAGFMVAALGSYFVAKRSILNAIVSNELPLTADNIYSEIQKDLIRPVLVSSTMANDTFLRDWALNGERDPALVTKYLSEVKARYGAFTAFFVSDRSRSYYHADGLLKKIQRDEVRDVWYFRVRDMLPAYEINLDPDLANKDALTIFINYRVLDYQGRFIGATGIGLTVDAVRRLIDDYRQRYQRNIYFVDLQGRVMMFSSADGLGSQRIQSLPGLAEQAEAILHNRGGSYHYQRDGHEYMLNVRHIPELNWLLFVERGEDEALGEVRHNLYLNLALATVVTLLVLLATGLTLRRYQQRLELMATTDKLTGLLNRQGFEILLSHAFSEARRHATGLAMLMVDVDHFKAVNDRYGHAAGDRALQMVADVMRTRLRESDVVCRWGGEEFLVVLKGCNANDAALVAHTLRRAVGEARLAHEQAILGLTISVGVAWLEARMDTEQLIASADEALLAAKQNGRNAVWLKGPGESAPTQAPETA